jgi:hypothetical protein
MELGGNLAGDFLLAGGTEDDREELEEDFAEDHDENAQPAKMQGS